MTEERRAGVDRLQQPVVSIHNPSYLVYRYLFRDLRGAIRRYASGRVLDVGCGNKPYRSYFQRADSYTGCDIVQSSRRLVDVVCPATRLPFEDETFDTVFSTQVLEHIADHAEAFFEIRRVLRPGGHFIFSVPFAWELHEEPFDYFRFTKYGIRAIADRAAFEQIELIPNGGKWAALGQLRINVLWSRFRKTPALALWHRRALRYSGFLAFLNIYYRLLDRWEFDDLLSLNYVGVVRKPVGPATGDGNRDPVPAGVPGNLRAPGGVS